MRRPTPALVIACVALFAALGGIGFAASRATQYPLTSIRRLRTRVMKVPINGVVPKGSPITSKRVAVGVYALSTPAGSFAKTFAPGQTTVSPLVLEGKSGAPTAPAICDLTSSQIESDGSAKVGVDCFAYGSTGWQPADTAFNVEIVGPGS